MNEQYVVVGSHDWTDQIFDEVICFYPGTWTYISDPAVLTLETLSKIQPNLVFFLHWSLKVPSNITSSFECVGFHMTDLPYGRGGTPLQNLILRGHQNTKLSAFKLVDEMDAGPIYLKTDLSLEGSAEEIYFRTSYAAADMIRRLIEEKCTPKPQVGTPTIFNRQTAEQSRLSAVSTLNDLYDFVRMLDAPGYPHAFLEHGPYRFELFDVVKSDKELTARVRIVPRQP